ncbi:MAG: NAD(P)/FAD-dependent oxidoreductase [Campylobacterota bacterium]
MQKVLILGGGYAGIYALKELSKNKDISITVVDKHTYHNLQPEVYDFIANKADVADVTIDLSTLCAGFDHPHITFLNKRVTGCDFDKNAIICSDGDILEYDYILFAMGSRTLFPRSVEGLKNTDDIKKLHRALYFKQSFECDMYEKIANELTSCQESHIVVVGAGLSGVEIAAEMAHFSAKFFKGGKFACEKMQITLVSGSHDILPGLDAKLVKMSRKRLNDLGINIISGVHMSSCDDTFVTLSNKQTLPYSFIIFAGGIEAANLTSQLPLSKNKKGQLQVDEYQRVKGCENIFAAGDVCVIEDKNGDAMPPNVTVARESGKIAAKNILASIEGKAMCDCKPFIEGVLVALGGRYAACNLYDKVHVSGFIGYLIKQYVFYRYKLPLQKISQIGYAKLKKQGVIEQ